MATRARTRLERAVEREGGQLRGYRTGRDGNVYAEVTTAGGRRMSVPVPAGSSDK